MGYKHLTFPENATFLVTGVAGFIGSNICEAILNLGCSVCYMDNLSTVMTANVEPFIDHYKYTIIKGDIKNLSACMNACKDVDYVLNEAAWGSASRSIEMPLFYCGNNI